MQKAEQGKRGAVDDSKSPTAQSVAPSADWRAARVGELDVWQSTVLAERCGLPHAFTSVGGNLSLRHGVDTEGSRDRRRLLCAALHLDADRLVCGAQVHGTKVVHVDDTFFDGRVGDHVAPGADGLVTRLRGVPLLALSADCPLIVLYDADAGALGLAHSGWRGTVANMPGALVRALVECCGASAAGCVAVVSPCAGGSAYEIRDDVYDLVADATGDADSYVHRREGFMSLNLPKLIADQLATAGVPQSAIHLPEQCTITDKRFFSYRRDGANTGHAGLIVSLKSA